MYQWFYLSNFAHIDIGSDSVCCKAHKYMLTSRSPVFDAMFYGEMAEEGDIIVEDTKPQDFKQLLKSVKKQFTIFW